MEITNEIVRKMQLLELKILIEIKRVCEKHNIEFFLIEGSLLGAVRHNGFIPWDDDIDIGMTRINFDKFCRIAPLELSKDYFFQTHLTDKQYFDYNIARVRLEGTKFLKKHEPSNFQHNGFLVDIFVFDNIPHSFFHGYFHWTIFKILIRVNWLRNKYNYRPNKIYQIILFYFFFLLCLPISNKRLNSILLNYHRRFENKNGNYIALLRGGWGFYKERCLRSTISKIIYVPFEGIPMPVPEKYHEYLRKKYGDYMTPPPPKDRKFRHTIKIDFGQY